MCCILGIGWQSGHTIKNSEGMGKVAKKLLEIGQIRGKDASGMAFTNAKEITVVKHNVKAEDLVEEAAFEKACEEFIAFDIDFGKDKNPNYNPMISVIGHCRSRTKGTPENYDNNHPITANKIVGVHNGIIYNDDKLFKEFEELGIERKAQVDSEIIFRLIDHYIEGGYNMEKAIKTSAKLLSGSYACALVDAKHPYEMWLFKNNSPIDIHHYKDTGVIIFSSDKSYINNAVKDTTLGDPTVIPLLAHQGIGIDLYRNTYRRFDIDDNIDDITDYYC